MLFGKQIQFVQRVHEKCCAAAEFFAQHGNACLRMVKCFHNHVLELVSQEIFHGGFVQLRHFGVIGQQSDGAEIASIRGG